MYLSPGVGVAMVMVTLIVSIYYNVILAYSLYYMFASFQSPLPWSSCSNWADSNCSNTPTGTVALICHYHGLMTNIACAIIIIVILNLKYYQVV